MVHRGMDSTLMRRLARREYVVNERAVAEAIITRLRSRGRLFSGVLVAAEAFDELALGTPEGDPAAGGHAA
jgi:hypothetical protein